MAENTAPFDMGTVNLSRGLPIPQICKHCEKPLAGEDGTIDAKVTSSGVEVVCRNCGETVNGGT